MHTRAAVGLLALALCPRRTLATYHCDNGQRKADGSDLGTRPAYHFYPDTIQSQDISGPIKIGDTWHVFMDCVPEGCPALLQPVQDKPLSWCHFSSPDLVHWAEHPIAIAPDHDFDGSIIDTGAVFQHPNGTVFAIYATSNTTSNLASGTFDGDICLAVSEDPGLLVWRKLCKQPNAVIVNPTCHWCRTNCPSSCKDMEKSNESSPFPGIQARMAHRDPVSPWLDQCEAGSTKQCWYAMSGSGGVIPGNEAAGVKAAMVLWKTDYDISTTWEFVKIFWNSPGNIYSCPDFFRLPNSSTFVFTNLDSNFWLGSYGHAADGSPSFEGPMIGGKTAAASNGTFNTGIFKTGGEGPNNVMNASSRRIMWGTIGWCGGNPYPSENDMTSSLHVGSVAALARDLSVRADGGVGVAFVPELQGLRLQGSHIHCTIAAGSNGSELFTGRHAEFSITFAAVPSAAETQMPYGLSVLGSASRSNASDGATVAVLYNPTAHTLTVTGGTSQDLDQDAQPPQTYGEPRSRGSHTTTGLSLLPGEALSLHVFVDGNLVEVVANGRSSLGVSVSEQDEQSASVRVQGWGGAAEFDAWTLKSIWR